MKLEISNSQNELLEAVLGIIVQGGIDAVRYRAVAEEANVSVGTVSYHYKTRAALLQAALKYYLNESAQKLFKLRDKYNSQKLSDISDYLVEVCKSDFKDKRRLVLVEYELLVYAARDHEVANAFQKYENMLIAELARKLDQAGCKQPFQAAQILSEMVRGFQLSGLGVKKHNFEEFGNRINAVLTGL